jgi:hypothetical protein
MPENQKPLEIPTELAEQLKKLIPPHLAELAELTVTRSSAFNTIYANIFRTRISITELTMIFSRLTHTPSILAQGNVIEEQCEIIVSWPQAKLFLLVLKSIVDAFENETGPILIPTDFQPNMEGQQQAVRSLGLPSAATPRAPRADEQLIQTSDLDEQTKEKERKPPRRKRPAPI